MAENINYMAMLTDMEAKRDALAASIASLRAFLDLPTQGERSTASASLGQSTSQSAHELPKGALLNKSLPEAIKLYLRSVAEKKTARAILEALQSFGVESTSDNFASVIHAALTRLKANGEVLRFQDGWGLAELYPAHIRNAGSDSGKPKAKPAKRAKKSKSKKLAKKVETRSPQPSLPEEIPEAEGPGSRVERYVSALTSPVPAGEIAAALSIKVQTVCLILSKLAHKGRVAKTNDGKYGLTNQVQEMPRGV